MSVAPESGRNRIMIYGPKNDGTYIVDFKTADGEALAISRLERPACSSTSRSGCRMGCSCLTFREESLALRRVSQPEPSKGPCCARESVGRRRSSPSIIGGADGPAPANPSPC
jgi:hypothetical protein